MIRACAVRAIGLTAVLLPSVYAQASPTARQEMDRLRGTFAMLAGVADGQEMPPAMMKSMKRVSTGSETTVTMAGTLYLKANYAINTAAMPKTIDYDMTGGFTTGKRQLGIFRTSGDTVVFCFGSPGNARPAAFESKAASGVTCSTWKRESP